MGMVKMMNTRILTIVLATLLSFTACENGILTPKAATVSFHGNGAVTTSNSEVISAPGVFEIGGGVEMIQDKSFVRSGYVFLHWNTAQNGSGSSYLPGAQGAINTANMIFYAQWRELSALELLAGLTSRLKTQYEIVDGKERALKEWSWSWNSVGAENLNYYAEYTYSATLDQVLIYTDDTKATFLGKYEYTYDANGDMTHFAYKDDADTIEEQWQSTYNPQHKYLTFQYYSTAVASDSTMIENRTSVYAPDGINYTKEVSFYGSGTDESTDLMELFVPTYENGDPTTGKIVREVKTQVIRPSADDQNHPDNVDPLVPVTIETTYLFSWKDSDYVYQQSSLDKDGVIQESIQFTYAKVKENWEMTSRLFLTQNSPNNFDTYTYNDVTGKLMERQGFDIRSYDKQMDLKKSYYYETDTQGNLFKIENNYTFTITRSLRSATNPRPKFIVPSPARLY